MEIPYGFSISIRLMDRKPEFMLHQELNVCLCPAEVYFGWVAPAIPIAAAMAIPSSAAYAGANTNS